MQTTDKHQQQTVESLGSFYCCWISVNTCSPSAGWAWSGCCMMYCTVPSWSTMAWVAFSVPSALCTMMMVSWPASFCSVVRACPDRIDPWLWCARILAPQVFYTWQRTTESSQAIALPISFMFYHCGLKSYLVWQTSRSLAYVSVMNSYRIILILW